MSDAILIFTFSPVQSFIAEARRTADLCVGSRILVELAQAAGEVIAPHADSRTLGGPPVVAGGAAGEVIAPPADREQRLIYPADLEGNDIPNRLVARVPWEQAQSIAKEAQDALLAHWQKLADQARGRLAKCKSTPPDGAWDAIWKRQIDKVWEVYWSIARVDEAGYKDAYKRADRGLDAAKRTRAFDQVQEPGMKDTLSGRRSALHRQGESPKDYWKRVAEHFGAVRIQPEGRERLDAIGAIKRFCDLADTSFPSTSTVAAADYIAGLKEDSKELRAYRDALRPVFGGQPERAHTGSSVWPYDGDLLYEETLAAERLRETHAPKDTSAALLRAARETLRRLHATTNGPPSPYYAIIVLDGDSMGERIAGLETEEEHREFSRRLGCFARAVQAGIGSGQWANYHASLIYNGGDDVLALAPLAEALPLAQDLAKEFESVVGGTASAGIAIAHHLYPLDAALRTARDAESRAKKVEVGDQKKAAVCVRVLKRSGQDTEMRSRWEAMGDTFTKLVDLFKTSANGPRLASRFAYDLLAAAPALPEANEVRAACCQRPEGPAMLEAELKRLLKRHRNRKHPAALADDECDAWAARLRKWAAAMPGIQPEYPVHAADAEEPCLNQTGELGRWLALAHWIAQGGKE